MDKTLDKTSNSVNRDVRRLVEQLFESLIEDTKKELSLYKETLTSCKGFAHCAVSKSNGNVKLKLQDDLNVLRLRGGALKTIYIQYTISNNNTEEIEIKMESNNTFEGVKNQIFEKLRVPPNSIILKLRSTGEIIEDNRLLTSIMRRQIFLNLEFSFGISGSAAYLEACIEISKKYTDTIASLRADVEFYKGHLTTLLPMVTNLKREASSVEEKASSVEEKIQNALQPRQ